MALRKRAKRSAPATSRGKAPVVAELAPPAATTIGGTMGGTGGEPPVETTGRFVVIFKEQARSDKSIPAALRNAVGAKNVVSSADSALDGVAADELAGSDSTYFNALGIAVVSAEAVQSMAQDSLAGDSEILAIEPEYIAYPSAPPSAGLPLDYLRGYRDAVNHLYDGLVGETAGEMDAQALGGFQDTAQFTWGLQATRASTSSRSGRGIKVAVLDTGMDFQHPDFLGRAMISKSFIPGVTPDDIFGHGTHCIGTACGPQRPASGVRRYGVAFDSQIFVGKVFNNTLPRPGAPTGAVIAAIEWAVANGCSVVSLSLGAPIDQKVQQYEVPIRRALNAGTLIVAAAGNNAQRPANPGFVEPPANSDAAMAVAAIDSRLAIAPFSARSSRLTGIGGIVNIAAPGVAVFSSVPVSKGTHASFQGTSMATPHVAGLAALWAQATGERGQALWNRLVQSVRPLNLPSVDVGGGLAQAPQ